MDQQGKNVGASMNQPPRWKVWIFIALPVIGALLAVAGHLFLN